MSNQELVVVVRTVGLEAVVLFEDKREDVE